MVEWTAIIVFETTGDDHNQVDQCPDAQAPPGEQHEDTADDAPRVEAMHAECPQKLAEQHCCDPVLLHPHSHHRPWIGRLLPLGLLPRPGLWRLLPLGVLPRSWIGRLLPLGLLPRPWI